MSESSFETEPVIEPDLAIIDPHHHIWLTPVHTLGTYTPEQLFKDKAESGHNVVATVFIEANEAYRTDGPEHLRPVGEAELAQRIGEAADAKGGRFAGICAGFCGAADLRLGAKVTDVLDAHLAAAPKRFRGIRHQAAHDEDAYFGRDTSPDLLSQPDFRTGFAKVAERGLVFEAWVLHPQLKHVASLAQDFPQAKIVLNHVGGPVAIGRYRGRRAEAFFEWRDALRDVAVCQNVFVKLGGLAIPTSGAMPEGKVQELSSQAIAGLQRDHLLTAIDLFGPQRAMFESNYPVDRRWTNYRTIWNAFKRVAEGASPAEKRALFHDNAAQVYQISR